MASDDPVCPPVVPLPPPSDVPHVYIKKGLGAGFGLAWVLAVIVVGVVLLSQ